ncbi:MAG: cytochrome c oxidase accessory protein CcoG [Burkholderiales bacterium]
MASSRVVHKIFPANPEQAPGNEESLFEIRQKIYPRAVTGSFATARVVMVLLTQLLYYGLPWLEWNGRQAVLFDLVSRKFFIFGLVFWPQDFIYLTVLLVISALSLFLFTAVAGRLWCGYACPQTVYTEIFLWIERKIEGSSAQQKKRDQSGWTANKIAVKSAKHGIWIAFALWTGFTLVGYFTPIKTLAAEVLTLTLGPWETFWVLFYGFATYGNAGFMREQVCKYMCPYARFQGVMFDPDTLTVTYDNKRGEPRGARSRKTDQKAVGLGDCVDCGICVQVCPTGIDIRKGLQIECIGCAACIDGCDKVMDKMGYPKGLIRYATEHSVAQGYGWNAILAKIFRPRVLIYTAILWSIIAAAALALYQRAPVKVDVIRDRGTISREVEGGKIENVYRLQIMNVQEKSQRLKISVPPVGPLRDIEVITGAPLEVAATETRMVPLRLRAQVDGAFRGSTPITFVIEGTEEVKEFSLHEKSSFIVR